MHAKKPLRGSPAEVAVDERSAAHPKRFRADHRGLSNGGG
jgi:hypothetical protein